MPSPIAYWTLNETSGNRYDSTGNALTLSEQGGTVGATSGVFGGNAAVFSASNGWLSRAGTGALNLTGSLSITCWVKLDAIAGIYDLGICGKNVSLGTFSYILYQRNNTTRFVFTVGNPLDSAEIDTPNQAAGVWLFVAATWDNTAQRVAIYVNGVLSAESYDSATILGNSVNFNVGSYNDQSDNRLHGAVSQLAIWDTSLSATEIETLYYNGYLPERTIPTMPNIGADEIITNKHVRDFVQWKGAGPTNPPAYYGMDAQYFKMEGLSMPDGQGSISPRYMHDPRRVGKFKLVARQVSAPDLNAATMVLTERHGAIPRQLQRINCPVNIYENIGECKDPSDFVSGWSDYVLVYENGLVDGNKDGGNRSAWGDADDQLEDSLPMKFDDIYPIGALAFGDNATGTITLEVIDVIYVKANDCVDCDDWWIYAVTESSGSTPGTAPRLIYSTDNGETWSQASIDSLGDTEDPSGIEQVGKYLVVYTRTAGGATTSGYYYSEINQNTGAPGTWTKVTTGFVAGFQVRDMFVLSPREVFFCADDGYIYFSDDITAGVSVRSASAATTADLYRIHGENETVVSCGIGGIVVVSQNRGKTFSVTTASPVVATLQALCVVNDSTWWIGSATGKLYYTQTGGEVWTEKTFSGSGAGQVYDIIKVSPSVLFFSHSTATPTGRVFSTWNGGRDWTNSAPRILNMPTANRFNRLATPPADAGVSANNIAVAGLGGNGTDGILLLGIAARL